MYNDQNHHDGNHGAVANWLMIHLRDAAVYRFYKTGQKDKTKGQKDKNAKRQKNEKAKRKFSIATSGKFRTLAMFFLMNELTNKDV